MALSRTNLLGQISNGTGVFGSGAFTTSSFTPPDASLLVVGVEAIENGGSDPLLADLTISDSVGLTWTNRVDTSAGTAFSTGVRIWTAPVTTGVSMTLTLDCGSRSITEYAVSVVAYTGYNTGSPTGATGSNTKTSGFTGPPDAASLTLSSAPATTSEVFALIGADKRTADITPGSTWTEIHDVINTDWGGAESEVRTGSTSTTVDWVDVRPGGGALFNWSAVAVEILVSATVAVSLTDTATAVDALTVSAAVSLTDSAAGADALVIGTNPASLTLTSTAPGMTSSTAAPGLSSTTSSPGQTTTTTGGGP